MIPTGSMLRFKHNAPGWDVALVLRSYMCEDYDCCHPAGNDLCSDRPGEVIDILWNNGQRDKDYHLEGMSSDQLEVISQ